MYSYIGGLNDHLFIYRWLYIKKKQDVKTLDLALIDNILFMYLSIFSVKKSIKKHKDDQAM